MKYLIIMLLGLTLIGCTQTREEDKITCGNRTFIGYDAGSNYGDFDYFTKSGQLISTNERCHYEPTGRQVEIPLN